jgi:hypothetical protein
LSTQIYCLFEESFIVGCHNRYPDKTLLYLKNFKLQKVIHVIGISFNKNDVTFQNFNYQLETFGEGKTPCMCGAENCSGFIGEKPAKEKRTSLATRGRKPKTVQPIPIEKQNDAFCFRCFEEGKLLKCSVKTCVKAYHLKCVNQEKFPKEKWLCPWHHCVSCGKNASQQCSHCSNAYCKNHNSAIRSHPQLGTICDEHKDDLADLVKFYFKVKESESSEQISTADTGKVFHSF